MYMRETVFSPSRKGQGFCGVPGIQEGHLIGRLRRKFCAAGDEIKKWLKLGRVGGLILFKRIKRIRGRVHAIFVS